MNILCKRLDCKHSRINNTMQNLNICWRETVTLSGGGYCTDFKNRHSREELTKLKIDWGKLAAECNRKHVRYDKRVECGYKFSGLLCSYRNCPLRDK